MPKKTRLLRLKLADIDPSLLPDGVRPSSTSAFQDAVSQLLRNQLRQIGGLIELLAFTSDEVQVAWQPDRSGADPLDAIIKMLEQGQYRESILLLELLLSDDRDNPHLLHNLGMAYSDMDVLDRAMSLLRRLVTRRIAVDVTESPNPHIRSGEFYPDHFGDYYPDLDNDVQQELWARTSLHSQFVLTNF